MVTGMARFAENVGCALIAEGIETENELTALKLLNIQYGQGYFLARPAAAETFAPSSDTPLVAAAVLVSQTVEVIAGDARSETSDRPVRKAARRSRRRPEAA
jgi:predicted signal transduction protein with EAL and GGDEF domain